MPDADAALLRMEGIGKRFDGQPVLQDVDFDLRAGEVHVLAGENGAGKTTLMKILAGVHAEYEGSILLHGRPVAFSAPLDAARQGISCIHQELSLIPAMSVADNIFLGRERSGPAGWMRYGDEEAACRRLLDQLGLAINARRRVEECPIGVQQMVEIAKALAFDARIIVMDEPTSALTEPEVERLFAVIDDLKRRGCGIIYISHKMEEIYRIADRITVLRDGRCVGTREAVQLPRPELVRWMVGRDIAEQIPRHVPSPGDERLRVEGLCVPHPGGLPRPAVEDAAFTVRAGEILGIGGLQGSGASELLGGLFGRYGMLARGRVWLDGRPFMPKSPSHAIRNGLALLTNDRKTSGLVLDMGMAQNMTLASVPAVSPGGWMRFGRERARAAAQREALGIRAASLDQPVKALSGGNQQKVVLAKWLETGPGVLLLDEPTRGVDVGAKHEIYELMNQWTREGVAIMLITSEMPELLALSDRVIVMHRGRITAEFERGQATQERVLNAAMGQEIAK